MFTGNCTTLLYPCVNLNIIFLLVHSKKLEAAQMFWRWL